MSLLLLFGGGGGGGGAVTTAFLSSTFTLFPPTITLPGINPAPLKLLVEVGRGYQGNSLRRTLINQQNVVFCGLMSDLVSEHGVKDLSGLMNNGTYEGTGYTRGVSVTDLAEGGVATHFNGNQQVRIPHDFLSGGRNLSFAAGGFDIYVYFRTSQNDANERGLVTKFHNPTTNGWETFIANGNLRAKLFVSGSLIFSVSAGNVADNQWHRVHYCYRPEDNIIQIFLDGVEITSAAASTEPTSNLADVIIAGWSHLSSSTTRFIGDLHYVMLSREGNELLAAQAETAIKWTDISDYLMVNEGLNVSVGSVDEAPLGVTAGSGKATLKLKNSEPLGLFSLGHADAMVGFDLWSPIRIRTYDGITIRPLYRGFISDINTSTGINGDRLSTIDCVDWMEVLSVTSLGDIEVAINQDSGYCIKRLVDAANRPPAAVDIDLGNEVFPFAFDQIDGVNGKILQEVSDVNFNEGGQVYIKRDGTFRAESRQRRQLLTAPALILAGDWQELDVGAGLHNIINRQKATFYPREASTADTVVVTGSVTAGATKRRQELVPGEHVVLQGQYSDPEERSTSVGAINTHTLVATTDYTMTENEDGTGLDLTSFVQFLSGHNPPQSGSSYNMTVVNNHPTLHGWLHFQIRARILRRFDPLSTFFDDQDSVNKYATREPSTIDLRYLGNLDAGLARCKYMVNQYKTSKVRPRTMSIVLDSHNFSLYTQLLSLELGDLVDISEVVSGIVTTDYWVQSLQYSFREGICFLQATFVPSSISGPVFIVGDAELGVVGTAVVGF